VSEDNTDAMVELEMQNAVGTITVPADALEDALNGFPDRPSEEVVMVTDSVIVCGDGADDDWVYVCKPTDAVRSEDRLYWFGPQKLLYNKIEYARGKNEFVEYVEENVFNGGDMEIEQIDGRIEFRSYYIGDDEIRRIVNDDRARLTRVYAIEYRDDNGIAVQVRDTE